MRTHLVVGDSHAHFQHDNDRADWLGNLIVDLRPDVVVHIGDSADMPSLSSYEKGKKSFQGRTYRADIDAHLDFQERMWRPLRAFKKKMPERIFCIGNHEQRIARAIQLSPELDGAIGYDDLQLNRWYDTIVDYDGNTPGKVTVDGVQYAHYFVSGIMGRPVGGEHPAHSQIRTQFTSTVAGHSHLAEWVTRNSSDNRRMHGVQSGCYMDYHAGWAGNVNDLWWRGLTILHNVEGGDFSVQFISMKDIEREYRNI